MKQIQLNTKQLTAVATGVLLTACGTAQAGSIVTQTGAPMVGLHDIAQLNSGNSDTLNIGGAGVTSTDMNDANTYVANDRSTQGQLFTTGSSVAGYILEGIWVQHVLYTDELVNGTWSGLADGTSITLRIVDPAQAGAAGFVMASQASAMEAGNGFTGGDNNAPYWSGSGNWLYMALDTPVTLEGETQYGFDLTSYGPWFELAGLDADQYGGGSAYTLAAKEDLNTGSLHAGDRTFVVALSVVPEPSTLALAGLGLATLLIRRRNTNR